mmetsp:Transcript_1001/g.1550  ORF Transcript_1001/g.1550 Transcript_1001/m.1550 type:complete len:116 (+) Transcript_1001:344-691(+)
MTASTSLKRVLNRLDNYRLDSDCSLSYSIIHYAVKKYAYHYNSHQTSSPKNMLLLFSQYFYTASLRFCRFGETLFLDPSLLFFLFDAESLPFALASSTTTPGIVSFDSGFTASTG